MKSIYLSIFVGSALFFSCADDDNSDPEGCKDLAEKVFDCQVYPADFYEEFTLQEYEDACSQGGGDPALACMLDCDASLSCELFGECFVACNEAGDAGGSD